MARKSKSPKWAAELIDLDTIGATHAGQLELDIQVDENIYGGVDLLKEVLGDGITQGSLFAYLYRRFGFPNTGSDPERELARYVLSTPHPHMAMVVSPHVSKSLSLSFRFLVDLKVISACRDWPWRHVMAQRERAKEWVADEVRRPEWADAWVRKCQESGYIIVGHIDPEVGVTFRQTIDALRMDAYMRRNAESQDERHIWIRSMMAEYEKIEPEPKPEYRTADWRSWPDEDPLKAYVVAAEQTLRDLQRPVGIRDTEITIYGPAKTVASKNAADEAESAGVGAGAVVNADPDLFVELHQAIHELGKGDLAAGMKAVLEKLDRAPAPEGSA